mmetsp:Transcript_16683/g.40667  ORF Transcript_16683/g.40667 Transcript_16683/m.40667 type:complete len:250 (-) Transcript_16683:7-756(-)
MKMFNSSRFVATSSMELAISLIKKTKSDGKTSVTTLWNKNTRKKPRNCWVSDKFPFMLYWMNMVTFNKWEIKEPLTLMKFQELFHQSLLYLPWKKKKKTLNKSIWDLMTWTLIWTLAIIASWMIPIVHFNHRPFKWSESLRLMMTFKKKGLSISLSLAEYNWEKFKGGTRCIVHTHKNGITFWGGYFSVCDHHQYHMISNRLSIQVASAFKMSMFETRLQMKAMRRRRKRGFEIGSVIFYNFKQQTLPF